MNVAEESTYVLIGNLPLLWRKKGTPRSIPNRYQRAKNWPLNNLQYAQSIMLFVERNGKLSLPHFQFVRETIKPY